MSMLRSIGDVEQLVKCFYGPGNQAQIATVQETLQRLQRSEEGWKLADGLLESGDEKVRFFGALTFTVKLNSNWDELDDESALLLLQKLINWLCRLVAQTEGTLVSKKMCLTLVTYFLRFPQHWERCIRHLISSLHQGHFIPPESLHQWPETYDIATRLTPGQAAAALWFSTSLVDEVGKTNSNSLKSQKLHQRMASNVEDAAALINHAFNCSSGGHGPAAPSDESWLSIEGVKCFQSWMSYSRLALTGLASVEPLKYLTPIAVQYLTYDDMFDSTSDLFFDILSNYPNFLRPGDMQMLLSLFISDWAHVRLQGLQQGDFEFESLQFGRLLLAFGDATMEDLLRSPESPDSQQVLGMLHGLLGCKGYPIAEDEICSQALEFWIAFVDLIGDSQYDAGQDETKWLAHAHNHITQAIEECWPKLKVPPQSISTTWDSETKKGFKNFRIDVGDLLLSSYRLIGTSICDTIVRAVLSAVEERNWIDVEAALFALKALSDSIGEGDHEDKMLARLFGSSLFPSLSRSETSVPSKTRQTAISVLGQYSLFFERRTEYLPAVLSFLFKALETPMLATAASRSIFTLCSFCRDSLKFDIDTFLVQYDTLLTSRTAETLVKERILGAIAAMVQAIPTDYEKLEPLRKLLVFVQRDVDACLVHLDGGFQLEGEEYGVASLRCLTSIGKGMQELGDTVIDLDSTQAPSLFWTDGPGASIREEVVKMVENITEVVGGNGEIIEAACNVFRAGLTESSPGPFVFPPVVLTSFVLKSTPSTPRLGLVLTTACVLISSHSAHSSSRIDKEASHILSHVFRLICNAGDHDPEVAQNCIDFMIKLLPRYLNVLLNFEPDIAMKQLLTFTLTCLTGRDVLPKRSAANFWATFVVLKDQEATLQITLDTTILSLGPELAHILIFNVGGNAARSELDIISEPLKKMVFRQPRSRMWLEKALFSRDFPSDKVAAPEKRRFLQKIMNLRGAKGTNQVVKEFWLACRGTDFAYAS